MTILNGRIRRRGKRFEICVFGCVGFLQVLVCEHINQFQLSHLESIRPGCWLVGGTVVCILTTTTMTTTRASRFCETREWHHSGCSEFVVVFLIYEFTTTTTAAIIIIIINATNGINKLAANYRAPRISVRARERVRTKQVQVARIAGFGHAITNQCSPKWCRIISMAEEEERKTTTTCQRHQRTTTTTRSQTERAGLNITKATTAAAPATQPGDYVRGGSCSRGACCSCGGPPGQVLPSPTALVLHTFQVSKQKQNKDENYGLCSRLIWSTFCGDSRVVVVGIVPAICANLNRAFVPGSLTHTHGEPIYFHVNSVFVCVFACSFFVVFFLVHALSTDNVSKSNESKWKMMIIQRQEHRTNRNAIALARVQTALKTIRTWQFFSENKLPRIHSA